VRFSIEAADLGQASGVYTLVNTDGCDADRIFQVDSSRFLFFAGGRWILSPEICDAANALLQNASLSALMDSIPIDASVRAAASACGSPEGGDCDGAAASIRSSEDDALTRAEEDYRLLDPEACLTRSIFRGEEIEMYVFQLDGFWTLGPMPCSTAGSLIKSTANGTEFVTGLAWVNSTTNETIDVDIEDLSNGSATPSPSPGGDGDELVVGLIVGITAAGAASILALCVVIFILRGRRRVSPAEDNKSANESDAESKSESESGSEDEHEDKRE